MTKRKTEGIVTVRQPVTGRALCRDPLAGWRWGPNRKATPMTAEEADTMAARLGGVVCVDGVPRGMSQTRRPAMPKGKAPGEWDKRGELCKLIVAQDWPKALKIAKSYSALGDDKVTIERAWEAYARPDFCRALGRDPEVLKRAGIEVLKRRFSDG